MLDKERPDLPDHAMIIFSDLDEIPNGEMMLAMKHCEWKEPHDKIQFSQRIVTWNLRQVANAPPRCLPQAQTHHGGLINWTWARDWTRNGNFVSLRMGNAALVEAGTTHLSYFGSPPALMLKGLQHGEGGGVNLPKAYEVCNRSVTDIQELVTTLRDNPISIVRAWEHKSAPLPKETPSLKRLQNCGVPWALLENQERYSDFWGLPD